MFTAYVYEEVQLPGHAWERAIAEDYVSYGANPETLLIAEEEEENEEW